ncbi:MAG: type IV secretion system protein VirJ [Sphingomonas sp.]|nr:MAG: type IV secretion system protein VirJ [Sphingomonas sp.]
MARSARIILASVALLMLGAVGYLAYIGYYSSEIYRVEPARRPPPTRLAGTVAVFMSGDSGLKAGMATTVVATLAERGIPVLGVNSLTAFRSGRSPAATQALVADATRRALRLPGARQVLLIGQSFGADMLQYGVSALPNDLRPKVAQVILTVPGDTLLFKASPGGLLDGAPDGPALPSARRIDWVPVLCVYGREETTSLCPLLHAANVRVVGLPGGHYLHHDGKRLVDLLWDTILQARAVARVPHA